MSEIKVLSTLTAKEQTDIDSSFYEILITDTQKIQTATQGIPTIQTTIYLMY